MKDTYVFYLTFGTIPSLFSEINIFIDKRPSYVFVRSSGNFNPSCIEQLPHVKGFHQLTLYEDSVFFEKEYRLVVDAINKVKSENPDAKFVLFIDDSRVNFYLKPFGQANSLDDISKIVLISEGNASQIFYYNLKENDENEKAKQWESLKKNYNNDTELLKINNYSYWLSTKENVEYLVPYASKFKNDKVPESYRKKMHLLDLNIESMYNQLTEEQKRFIFDFDFLNIDKKKEYLIIVGTLDFGDKELTTAIIRNLVDQVLTDYSDYVIMYKAHPLASVDDNISLTKYLSEKNIKIIPNKVPIEIVLWEYKNIYIGGFASSIISLIDPKRVKFIFGQKLGYSEIILDKDSLIPTYNVLISSNMALHMLTLRYNIETNINKRFFNLESNEKNLQKEINELNTKLEVINRETRISRFFYSILRKIKHFFKKK